MKRILIFIVFNLFIFSCKENNKVEEKNITSKVSNSHTNVSFENKAEIKESLNQWNQIAHIYLKILILKL